MHNKGVKRENPWERVPPLPTPDYYYDEDTRYYLRNLVGKRPKFLQRHQNTYLDVHTKRAALKVSPSVVSLVSYTGEKELNQGCGTIIESDDNNTATVLTSANLIRLPTDEEVAENTLADNIKIVVNLYNGKSYQGELCVYDFHYNLATIRFHSDSLLSTATLKHIDDSINLNPSLNILEETPFPLRPHSTSFKLIPGDALIVVGRYFAKPFDLMAAPGDFRLDRGEYDCKELFMVTSIITRCGDGAPIVNLSGEVIGIAFYDGGLTPVMPINIAYKWWKHYKSYGELRRPSLGMEATNLYTADLDIAEKIILEFPNISKGVIVEKVISGSSAELAGLRLNDVIIQFGGKEVRSFLEFFEIIWDNVGNPVELLVARVGHTTPLHFKMTFVEAEQENLNSWPHWK